MSPVKPESMILLHVFNVCLENILATFPGSYSLSSQKGTTQILHLSKFANEPQDAEQNVWQTKAKTALRHIFAIRSSVMPRKNQKWAIDSMRYTVHLLLLGWMRPLKYTSDEERKRGQGFAAVLQVADQHWGGLEIKELFKKETSVSSPLSYQTCT